MPKIFQVAFLRPQARRRRPEALRGGARAGRAAGPGRRAGTGRGGVLGGEAAREKGEEATGSRAAGGGVGVHDCRR